MPRGIESVSGRTEIRTQIVVRNSSERLSALSRAWAQRSKDAVRRQGFPFTRLPRATLEFVGIRLDYKVITMG